MAIHERYFTIGDSYSGEISPVDQLTNVFGTSVKVGEGSKPEPEAYPGWELYPLEYPAENGEEGWVFSLAPATATPIGFIDTPENMEETEAVPTTRECAIAGEGIIIISSPQKQVFAWVVSSQNPAVLELHPGCIISYIALERGLTGISVNNRKNIPERILETTDTKIPPEFIELYTFWQNFAQQQLSS